MQRGPRRKSATTENLTRAHASPTTLVVLFYLLPFVSGATALIYEITWAKMLALTFGSTTLSAAAVIAGFMGGMGIGAWLYHLVYDRSQRPLVLYGLLEIGIAVTTALLSLTFYWLPEIFAQLSASWGSGPVLTLARFVSVFVLLLVPAALMGATFPALCTVMIRSARGVDRHLGMIYGVNTLGAAFGVVFAGMVLIERVGLSTSVSVANGLNILIALAAFALNRTALGRRSSNKESAGETTIPTDLSRRVIGVVLFVSGFTTLGYEIVWFRTSRYIFGNSTYALTTVLFVFLAGLGLGSMLLRWTTKRPSPERDLMTCQCAIAVLAIATIGAFLWVVQSPSIREHVSIFSHTVKATVWWKRLLVQSGIATAMMLPATIFMGLSFPLASRLFLGDVKKLGNRLGGAYFLANLGSIGGSILGAVLLLPHLGTIGGTKFLAILNLCVAAWIGLFLRRQSKVVSFPLMVTAIATVGGTLLIPNSFHFVGCLKEHKTSYDIEFVEEGDLATVQVLADRQNPDRRMMAIDGYSIGLSASFKGHPIHGKQLFLAHLPMVLDTRIRKTLNVGLGSASTLYTLASYPQIETLDCVEINEPVVHASRLFEESSVLDDLRTNIVVDDAVHYLLQSQNKYDLIISDGKQQISFSGNAILLSQEFYQLSLDHLLDQGLFIQWIPTGILANDMRIHVRTACAVFPHVNVFFYPPDSAIMVASIEPLSNRPRMSDADFNETRTGKDLHPFRIDSPAALLSHWTGGKAEFLQVLPDGPLNTWNHLLLEYSAFKGTSQEWFRAPFENLYFLIECEIKNKSHAATALGISESPYWESTRLIHRSYLESFRLNHVGARALAEQAELINPTDRESWWVAEHMRRRESQAGATQP